jgi:hypothetical protein
MCCSPSLQEKTCYKWVRHHIGISGLAFVGKMSSCRVNPRACHETELNYYPTPAQRRFAVVGAGPAGLSAATTLAEWGVTDPGTARRGQHQYPPDRRRGPGDRTRRQARDRSGLPAGGGAVLARRRRRLPADATARVNFCATAPCGAAPCLGIEPGQFARRLTTMVMLRQ